MCLFIKEAKLPHGINSERNYCQVHSFIHQQQQCTLLHSPWLVENCGSICQAGIALGLRMCPWRVLAA